MQHRPLFSPADIDKALQRELTIDGQKVKIKTLTDWKNGLASGKIQSLNERKLQSEFLNKIFGDVLGYAYEKQLTEWQLEHEYKVDFDGKTPDGVLGYFQFDAATKAQQSDVYAIIELKGPLVNLDKKQNRKDFPGTPVEQAFSYVPKLSKPCEWVIVSNCQEIRLYRYSLGMLQYEQFDLLTILEGLEFQRFCHLLQKDQLFLRSTDSAVETMLQKREQELKIITDRFYADYKRHRENLFEQIRRDNQTVPANELFQATQKLIDRLIFMCFARDLSLVENVLKKVTDAADASFGQENDKIMQELRRAFVAFDKGYMKRNIPPFNGGLFRNDTLLDELDNPRLLKIRDLRLAELMSFLIGYNFQGQLNVNVLGHIFEQSISDIEEIKARLQQEESIAIGALEVAVKPETSKRKREGVFYTPDYITRYIVEQAVGGWLSDRETDIINSLGLEQLPDLTVTDYETIRLSDKGHYERNEAIAQHVRFWELYQQQLEAIRVLDPACGSGAFLTQVLDFLWEKWRVLKEETYKLITPYDQQLKDLAARSEQSIGLSTTPYHEWEIKKDIVSRNIYGVDLNPESVEITKLALWLKTASKTETLANLDDHVRQGNSLVSDIAVSEHAFNWDTEFAGIRFDVVVGNPPYVSANNMSLKDRLYLNSTNEYQTLKGKWDLYIAFIERSLKLLNDDGALSFIVPYGLLNQPFGETIRKQIISSYSLKSIVDLHELMVFSQATIPCCIPLIWKKEEKYQNIAIIKRQNESFIEQYTIPLEMYQRGEQYMFRTEDLGKLDSVLQKMKAGSHSLSALYYISTGAEIHGKEGRTEDGVLVSGYSKFDVLSDTQIPGWKPYIEGSAIPKSKEWGRYCHVKPEAYLNYDDSYKVMRSPKFKELFDSKKIMIRASSGSMYILATLDDEKIYTSHKTILVIHKSDLPANYDNGELNSSNSLKYLLAILNSRLMDFYYRSVFGGFIDVYPNHLKALPIQQAPHEIERQFNSLVDKILSFHVVYEELRHNLLTALQLDFNIKKPAEALRNLLVLDWPDLLAELKKQKIGMSLPKQMEWKPFFDEQRAKALALQNERITTDRQIDQLVYALYGLTEAEIALVEKRS